MGLPRWPSSSPLVIHLPEHPGLPRDYLFVLPADQGPFKSQGAHIWWGWESKLGSTLSGVSSAKKLRCQVREPRKTRRHWPPSGPPMWIQCFPAVPGFPGPEGPLPSVFHVENLRFILNDNTKNNLTPLFF